MAKVPLMSDAEEEYLGTFLDRASYCEVFITNNRIFTIDCRDAMIRLAAVTVIASVAYIASFSLIVSQVPASSVLLPVLALVGLFPFLFLVMRMASTKFIASQRKNAKRKFEIRKEDILRVEMQKPGILTGQGKLAIKLRSGWFISFLVVGRRHFGKLRGLMTQFCTRGSIQLIEL